MIALYKDPQGKDVFKRMKNQTATTTLSLSGNNHSVISSDVIGDSEIVLLRAKVTELEEKVKQYEKRD